MEQTSPILQIRLFGGLHISLGDVPLSGFVSSKVSALFAYLAVTGRPHQRDALATLLWSEMSDADAKNNLRQALSNLRKLVEPYLDVTRETVAFRREVPYFLDVNLFRDLLQLPAGKTHANTHTLQTAVDLYRGDFLEGFLVREAPEFEEWIMAQRVRLRELTLQALHTLAELYLQQGDYQATIQVSSHLLSLDTWREEGHRQLMLALARAGQAGAALAHFRHCRQLMLEVFGVEPSDETTTLFERIRASLHGPRHNLPAPLTSFEGRVEELSWLRRNLAAPSCRMLTIVGPGGIGKTRLALQVAAELVPLFLNGVWFVSLSSISPGDMDGLAAALAGAVGLSLGAGDARKQLSGFLRDRELLLVLDNLEHLVGIAGWLSALLTAAPNVKILATSRERLYLQAEQVMLVEGMTIPPAATAAPDELTAYAAAALFVNRAQRSYHHFSLADGDHEAVARICRLVGGSPLGIELAAVAVRHFPCAKIADAIEANLDFLATTYQDVPLRQRTLRAAFDHSWSLMSQEEQAGLARLVVFRGGFTRHAAHEVAGVKAATVTSLVDKSLVHEIAANRYDLHEVVRQFAQERLMEDPAIAAQMHSRHNGYFAAFLAERTQSLKSSAQRAALSEIVADLDNVRTAWAKLCEQQCDEWISRALDALFHFYMLRGNLMEGLERFHTARLALEGRTHHTLPGAQRTLAWLMAREGRFLCMLARYQESRALLLQSLAILRDLQDQAGIAVVLGYLGAVATSLGEYDVAGEQLRASLLLRRAAGDKWGQAICLLELAGIDFYRADYIAAQRHCEEGLQLASEVGDGEIMAHLLTGLSIISRQLGDFARARDCVQRSLPIYEELEGSYGLVQGLLTLGGLEFSQANHLAAQPFFEQALAMSQRIGFRSGEADSYYRLGQIATLLGDIPAAVEHLHAALRCATMIQEAPLILDTIYAIAMLCAKAGISTSASSIVTWLLARKELDQERRATLMAASKLRQAPKSAMSVAFSNHAIIERAYELLLAAQRSFAVA